MIYLIDYDRQSGKLREMRTYPDEMRATAEYERLQLELGLLVERLTREVVLFEATDEASLRHTHSRYFESLEDLAARGAELAQS
ncbi:hypothetical protein SNE35_12830 [Paucibacter sp. R3-3]|uniref:Uncharacterized protein n=1 Tax=Roseateles agri TaxID=3098619 RepID=A0ABU5DGI7_9BURK|nr:hypothetical protein [Paucibacter sp. R3-3]MDY0745399.1 hypothetical protein [Paucibacter sp. R3-3]